MAEQYREKVSKSFTEGRPTLSGTLLKIKKFMGLGEPSDEETPESGTRKKPRKKSNAELIKKGFLGD